MVLELKDLNHAAVTINTHLVTCIIIPSIVSSGDTKSRIFFGQLILETSEAEARRVADAMLKG